MKRKTGGNTIKAQGAAFKVIDQYGFQHPSEIDVEAVILDRPITIRHGGLKGCEARLIRVGQQGIMRVRGNSLLSPRTRFALAHELGHWELHKTTQAFVCTPDNLRDYRADPMEAEANTFASELLMPTSMIRPIIEANDPRLSTAKEIADTFFVSLTAATIRMILETRHECVLVVSNEGIVEWWISGSERFGVWLEAKQQLGSTSVAFYLRQEPSQEPVSEVVPTEAWFLHLDSPERIEVTEESMRLGQSQRILSLLSLQDSD